MPFGTAAGSRRVPPEHGSLSPQWTRVLRSITANYVGRFIGMGIWFLLTPFVLHRLGTAGYGLWVLAGAIVGYGSLLDLGITSAINRYVAEHTARGEHASARVLVATSLWIYTAIGLVVLLPTAILASLATPYAWVPNADPATTTSLIWLIGVTIAITIPCIAATATLEGLQRYDLTSLATTIGNIVGAGLTLAVLFAGGGLLGVVAINIPSTLLTAAIVVWSIRRVAPELRFGWGRPSRAAAATIWSFSWSLLLGRVAKRVKTRTDEVVVAAFLPISAVAPYAVAHKASDLAQNLAYQFLRVLLPLASEVHASGDPRRLRALVLTSTRLGLAFFAPIGCTLAVLAGPLLTLWVGSQCADQANLVVILTLANLFETAVWPAVVATQGMNRHRPVAIASLVSALANLLLSIALVRPLGLAGVALGTLIPTSIECLAVVVPYSMRVIGIDARDAFRQVVVPSLAPAIPTLLTLWVAQRALAPSSWTSLLALAALGFLTYLLAYLAVGAGKEERHLAVRAIRQARSFPPFLARSVILSLRRIRYSDTSNEKRILRSFLPQDDTQSTGEHFSGHFRRS